MRLVKLKSAEGNYVYVNADTVDAVEEAADGTSQCLVICRGFPKHLHVDHSADDVVALLTYELKQAPH